MKRLMYLALPTLLSLAASPLAQAGIRWQGRTVDGVIWQVLVDTASTIWSIV